MRQARRGGGGGERGGDALFSRKSGIEAIETMRRKEERKPEAVNSGESCGTWVASDACDEDSGSDDGGGDCDPGSQRLRALLLEAKRAASESAPSSWCGDDSDDEEEEEGGEENGFRDSGGEIEQQKEDRPRERVVGRAASAPRLLRSGGTAGTTSGGAGGVCRGRDDGRGDDGDGDDQDGAAALLAALEDVLLCPPQVLARSSSCGGGQGRAPSLSSLLTRASKPRDGRIDGGGGGDDPGAGEGGDKEEKEADAAEAAVKAALAWKVPSRRLSCVLEEFGPAAGGGGGGGGRGGRAKPAATATKGNGDRVKPKIIPKAVPDKVSYSGGPAFSSPSEDDDGDAGGGGDVVVAGFGEEGGKVVVASSSVKGGGGGGGPTPPRRGSGSGSGESESTQSVGVGSTAIMTTPSRSPMSKGDEDRERPALATAASGGDGGVTAVVTREVSEATKFGDDSDHDNDDDHSGPVLAWPAGSSATRSRRGSGVGGAGSAGCGSFISVASSTRSGGEISSFNSRVRQGGGATKSSGGESPSPATRTLNREERIRTVFGQKAVEAAAATVAPASGSDSSSQLLFAAANRISTLPAQERSLLAELDCASDADEQEGDGDGGGFVDDAGVVVAANGDKTNEGVISSPQGGHEDGAPPSPSLSGDGNPARASAEPPLLRVGSGGVDGSGTTPFRYGTAG